MIVVRIELHSAITGQVSELARMEICNVGGSQTSGDYAGAVLRGRSTEQLNRREINKSGSVTSYPRLRLHVWNLVARMLQQMGYR